MNQSLLEKYAELIVKVGANVQNGQNVILTVNTDQTDLAKYITEFCYKSGAAYVDVRWENGEMDRLHYQYASTETLSRVLPWEEERAKQMTLDLPVRIFIESDDPDVLNGISADKLSDVGKARRSVLKKYRDEIDGKHQWVIAAAASRAWAAKVFPNDEISVAVEKLWNAIFECVYLDDRHDAVECWKKHIDEISCRAAWLNSQAFTSLRYKSKNGTDFEVGLIPGAKWSGAGDKNCMNNAFYVPNMPTEEIFTSPMRGRCSGRLVATKPLSWSGQLIDDFSVEFKDGRVCSCHAKCGHEILQKMFAMDEGASMLGEVALVPKSSPINQCNVLFYNTLFDENACCHVAVGEGFAEVLDGFLDMTREERIERGINDSLIHVDFMIGSDDLEIIGKKADGTEVDIFKNGTWADIVC